MGISKEERKLKLISRITRMSHRPQNIKCPGVLRKATRQLRNLEKEEGSNE